MKKYFRLLLAALPMMLGLTSCSSDDNPVNPVIPAKDLLYQWVVDYDMEDIEGDGVTADHAVKVYEFFADGTGYYEYYLLNKGELEFVEYMRGFNGEFTYTVSNNMVTIKLLDEFDELEPIWELTFTDGHLIDPDDRVFRHSTDAEHEQILEWYTMWNNNPPPPDINVAENIIGKWIVADRDGRPMLTNEKVVLTFVSATKVTVSASVNNNPEMGELWVDKVENDIDISGNKITVTGHPDAHTTVVEEYFVTDINTNEFMANFKATKTVDGIVVTSTEDAFLHFVKVTEDYMQTIVGLWECQGITGVETNNDDNARLEFLADGNYNFYRKNDVGEWSLVSRERNEYFVDGNYLATRWQSVGEEMAYEWWEISTVSDGQMQWTALRQNADGSTAQQGVKWTKVN